FTASFVKLPHFWIERLRHARHVRTVTLAHVILLEAFRRQHVGGEIILSTETKGLDRHVRAKAAKELKEFGLIETEKNGNQATRVTSLLSTTEEKKIKKKRRGPCVVSNDTRRCLKRHATLSQTTRDVVSNDTRHLAERSRKRHAPGPQTACAEYPDN